MSVRNAVAQRDAAPVAPSPAQVIKHKLDVYRPVISKLLNGTGIGEETFVAQIANACRAVPELWQCEPESLLGAALKAAQLGLAPNDARNLCWILPYGRRDEPQKQAQFQLGYGGALELARRAVPGLRFDGRAVFPNDEFDVDFGAEQPLTHRPAVVRRMERGGDAYAWYVVARFPDGAVQVHVLDRAGVEYHRAFSKQPNGQMWTKSYDAAALKSVVMDMRRWLPSSAQLTAAFASDEQVVDVRTIEPDVDVIDVDDAEQDTPRPAEPEPEPTPPEPVPEPDAAVQEPEPRPTQAQMRKLMATLKDAKIVDDERHDWATVVLHRDISSFSDLTRADVAHLTEVAAKLAAPAGAA